MLEVSALCWFFLDFTFCDLNINSSPSIACLWASDHCHNNVEHLARTAGHETTKVARYSILSSALYFELIRYVADINIRLWSFSTFVQVSAIIGLVATLGYVTSYVPIPALYFFSLIIFNTSPEGITTFLVSSTIDKLGKFGFDADIIWLPAQWFPTRYRASCNGITTASGKIRRYSHGSSRSVCSDCFVRVNFQYILYKIP